MKFNLDEVIPEVVTQYEYGVERFVSIRVNAIRSIDVVTMTQDSQCIVINEDQAIQLYKILNQVFGDLN